MQTLLQWKSNNITYSECVLVASVYQHAMRMHYIVICDQPSLQYFSTLSHKRQEFSKKKLLNTKCVFLIFATTLV
jgi:hypothetical protein